MSLEERAEVCVKGFVRSEHWLELVQGITQSVAEIGERTPSSIYVSEQNIVDLSIRTVQPVDRSRYEHSFAVEMQLKLSRRIRASAGYRFRIFDYRSQALLDPAHSDRKDEEHVARAGFTWKFRKRWEASIEGRFDRRKVNKSEALLDDEEADKQQTIARISIGRRF